jgi:hypothetical protein
LLFTGWGAVEKLLIGPFLAACLGIGLDLAVDLLDSVGTGRNGPETSRSPSKSTRFEEFPVEIGGTVGTVDTNGTGLE